MTLVNSQAITLSMKNIHGFTLIELLTTVAVIAIALSLAAPNINSNILDWRMRSQSTEVMSSLMAARMEVLQGSAPYTLCASSDPAAASPSCDAGKDWSGGWILFRDWNGNAAVDILSGVDCNDPTADPDNFQYSDDCIMRVWTPVSGTMTLTGSVNHVHYLPGGSAESDASSGSDRLELELTADDCGVNQRRTFVVNSLGRPSVSLSDCP